MQRPTVRRVLLFQSVLLCLTDLYLLLGDCLVRFSFVKHHSQRFVFLFLLLNGSFVAADLRLQRFDLLLGKAEEENGNESS